ncbi:hypothetical protein HYALB_00003835 [Hymenoscyphus albidus]|uniref:Uncharacterized protein n=1 Tax=Hymenoscyphus albidus TaxID=595503 RepID=A0A9N9LWX9_9HELO|nr:hypothetical protein HYALB_00003835 [Hymenoscyphus albidus]
MADLPRVFGHLVQSELSKAPCTNTHEDLHTAIDTLSGLTRACESVLSDIIERGDNPNLCQTTKAKRSDPHFLFRAHKRIGGGQPVFTPEINLEFDQRFRCTTSTDDLAQRLAVHLNKFNLERQLEEKIVTHFVSMSPQLEWAFHATGQRWQEKDPDEEVGLAIFYFKILQQDPNIAIFRVEDILDFLIAERKDYIITEELAEWARNCDEYISFGEIPTVGFVNWITWENLSSPSSILPSCFLDIYTLGNYRKWIKQDRNQQNLDPDTIRSRVFEFTKLLCGTQENLFYPLRELVLKPGLQFWGYTWNAEQIFGGEYGGSLYT